VNDIGRALDFNKIAIADKNHVPHNPVDSMKPTLTHFLAITFFIIALLPSWSETLTYPDLVHRLTDLDHLAVPPPAGERGALASSYDRASKYDPATDTYIHWDANGDGSGIVRQEGDESVLAEIKGPGCIWRTWSATVGNGHVKIYLDGDTTPAVDLPFNGYFNGQNAPFNRPNLVYKTAANGFDNYTPIPFLKSCKIVADKGWGSYYHFNYTQFPAGTVVPTFKLPLSAADSAALDEADKIMGTCGVNPSGSQPGEETQTAALNVPAGQTATVAELQGAGAITALKVKFDLPTDPAVLKDFLRQLAVRITWDNAKEPAVWAPLGDFFGDAVLPAKYLSLPMGITDDGQWYSYWYMPYGSGAKIEIENQSGIPVAMNWEVTHAPLTQPATSLLRFHAKWHRDAFLPDRKDRFPDWTLLTTKGVGRFVGTQLHIWNARGGWWGEGDEKWFVDGEKFPSTYGTGSEDYFGYAWSSGKTFNQALHGQPVNENNRGNISVHRWHIADNIPFQNSFEGDIEKYFQNDRLTFFAAVAYWYLSADGTDPYPEVPVAERIGYYTPLVVYQPDGMVEGENLDITQGWSVVEKISAPGEKWSGDAHLILKTKRLGAHMEGELTGPKAGKYTVFARYTHSWDYGIAQLSINGTPVGSPVDLYAAKESVGDPVELGTANFVDGRNAIRWDITGKNDKSQNYLVGIDYLKLVPVP
jgi:hypothetical protein